MSLSLYEIGLKHNTDKSTYHLFTVVYDRWLNHLRDKPVDLLEIGIDKGYSIRMWQEYFYNHNCINGVDINHNCMEFGDRVKIWHANQEDVHHLHMLPTGLDIIIDDGGHTMSQQQISLAVLFEHLKPGGIYILEDLHTSDRIYNESYSALYGCTPANNSIRFLSDLQNGFISCGSEYYVGDAEFNRLKDQIASIELVYVKSDSITSRIIKKY